MNYRIGIIGLLFVQSCMAPRAESNSALDENAFELESKNGLLVDVRTQSEVADGMIARAKHVDFYGPNFLSEMEALGKTKPLYLYCRSGGRSAKALEMLKAEGFTRVHHLDGGFIAWKASGKPSVQP
ncbi:MAG: rhodanese-like domain-containing protein [Cryomorphaceae bacterium]|nr:rhodanese-like domain-containing protein [Cryomorphaceae bacterium]